MRVKAADFFLNLSHASISEDAFTAEQNVGERHSAGDWFCIRLRGISFFFLLLGIKCK